jgi:hypothetical protein
VLKFLLFAAVLLVALFVVVAILAYFMGRDYDKTVVKHYPWYH